MMSTPALDPAGKQLPKQNAAFVVEITAETVYNKVLGFRECREGPGKLCFD